MSDDDSCCCLFSCCSSKKAVKSLNEQKGTYTSEKVIVTSPKSETKTEIVEKISPKVEKKSSLSSNEDITPKVVAVFPKIEVEVIKHEEPPSPVHEGKPQEIPLPENNDPPEWLTSSFVESTLQSKEPEIKVNSIEIEPAVPQGENYSCIVHRIKVNTSMGSRALIVKCIPTAEIRAKLMQKPMSREIKTYANTLPFLKGDYDKPNVPQFYTSPSHATEILILSDMSILGYKIRNRRLGMDEIHCKLAMTELAHLHAHSIALRINHPQTFESKILKDNPDILYSEENRIMFTVLLNSTIQHITEMIRNKFPYRFKLASKILDEILKDNIYNELQKLSTVPESAEDLENTVVTLIHGDYWSNNLLFQYVEGKTEPQACALIDFQAARCASPVIDLLYFFFTSTTQKTRREHLDSLLQHYMAQVLSVLHKKGIQDPGKNFYSSLAQLKEDMNDKLLLGLICVCFVLPAVIADPKDAVNIDDFSEEEFINMTESPIKKILNTPLFRERFQEVLEDMDDMGLFKKKYHLLKGQ